MAGKYDDLAEELIHRTGAQGVLVVIMQGDKGSGMSFAQHIEFDVAATANLAARLPTILHEIAEKVREQQAAPDPEAV